MNSRYKKIAFLSLVLMLSAAVVASVTAAPAARQAPAAAAEADRAPAPAKAAAPSPMNFSEAMQATIAVGLPNLTDAQSAQVADFFGDGSDTAPRVSLLKNMVYRKAVRDGAIPPGTEMGAVNWQGLLAFLQGLLPIIEAIIKMFGG